MRDQPELRTSYEVLDNIIEALLEDVERKLESSYLNLLYVGGDVPLPLLRFISKLQAMPVIEEETEGGEATG